jgi:GTP:adenosylcobinamide-phosphate guanylyltransferase
LYTMAMYINNRAPLFLTLMERIKGDVNVEKSERTALQIKLERNIEAAKVKVIHLKQYVEAVEKQVEFIENHPELVISDMFNSGDRELDVLAEQFNEVQLMTFIQFMEAVKAGRISMHYEVKPAIKHLQLVHSKPQIVAGPSKK